jgi:hypothetical protein
MKLDEAFPSNYVKSSDLKGRSVEVIIANYAMEKLGDDTKLVLYFQGASKGMVLNKTNATEIADAYTDELDQWIGRKIELYVARVDFQGKKVDGLRVRIPQQPPHQNGGFPQQQQHNQQSPQAPGPMGGAKAKASLPEDYIPF